MRQNKKEEEPLPTALSSSLSLLLSSSLSSLSYSSLQTLIHSIILKRKSGEVIDQMDNLLKVLYEKKLNLSLLICFWFTLEKVKNKSHSRINLSSIKLLFSDLLFYKKGISALFGGLEKSAKKEGFLSKSLFEIFKKQIEKVFEALLHEIGNAIERKRKGERGKDEEGGWINRMMAKMDEIDEGVLYKRYEEFLLSESRRYFEPKTEVGKRDFIEYLRFCRKRHEKELEIAEEYLQLKSRPLLLSLFNSLYIFPHNSLCFENSLPLSSLGDFLYFSFFSSELFSSFLQSFTFHLSSSLSSLLPNKIEDIFALFSKYREFIRNFERTLPPTCFSRQLQSSERLFEFSMMSRCSADNSEFALSINLMSKDLNKENLSSPRNIEIGKLSLYLLALKDTFISSFRKTLNNSIDFPFFYIKWLDKRMASKNNQNLDCNEAFKFFDFIDEKDRFLLIYEQHLSKRLLRKRADLLKEEEALKLFAEKIGASLVSKLFSKLEDFRKALALFDDHQRFIIENPRVIKKNNISIPFNNSEKFGRSDFISLLPSNNNNIDFSFLILAQNLWSYDVSTCSSLLPELSPYFQQVESWYKEKFQGRKLAWLEEEEEGVLILRKNEGGERKEEGKVQLICDRGVAKFLMKFNREQGSWKEEEHKEEEDEETFKILGYLCERRVMSRTNEGFEIHEELRQGGGRVINLNRNRRSKKEGEKRNKEGTRVICKNEEELVRRIRVESLIIRIMKTRKKLGITDLLEEVNQQEQSFTVEKLWLESVVEGLVGREYLEKDKDKIVYIG